MVDGGMMSGKLGVAGKARSFDVQSRQPTMHRPDGARASCWRPRISTTIASTTSPRDLAALCQRCHIFHDKAEHLRRRRLTYFNRRALGDLFIGPYPVK
jgi:hypothetical protein